MIDHIKQLVLKTANVLQQQNLTLATAESCTGGGLAYWLTSLPGSSRWFDSAYVTYSNAAKMAMLDVQAATLKTAGAVSEATAREMAEGVLKKSRTDISIAITGIAGPTGGTQEKPVGTVWIAWGHTNQPIIAQHYLFTGDRQAIRLAAIAAAMEKWLELV